MGTLRKGVQFPVGSQSRHELNAGCVAKGINLIPPKRAGIIFAAGENKRAG